MRREMTNRIRFVLEDIVPPVLRDSGLFKAAASMAWGNHVADLARFRERAAFLSDEEYEALYRKHPRVHEDTDNSDACIASNTADIVGASAMDVGCGTGALLRRVRRWGQGPVPQTVRSGRGRWHRSGSAHWA